MMFVNKFKAILVQNLFGNVNKIPEALMNILLDCETPPNAYLSAKYKRSFAYPSMKDRVPVILTQIVDYLSRDRATIIDCYGPEVQEEIKTAIGEISQLKNHLQTSKNFEYFTSDEPDTVVWNDHLKKKEDFGDDINYFESEWLFAECYLYRRVREIFATKKMLKTLDPFSAKKTILLRNSLPAMECLFHHLSHTYSDSVMSIAQVQAEFSRLVRIALWANKFDLSLSTGVNVNADSLTMINQWNDNILVDDSTKVLSTLCSTDNTEKIIDIVTDNVGLEVLCDLCLADFLITKFFVKKINFRVKPIPWFVSDVISRDLKQTILSVAHYPNEHYQAVGKRWQKYLDSDIWTIFCDQYWCLGKHYSDMPDEDPELYRELKKSSLIIMKGDLNYRKLLRETNWDPTTSFHVALGRFRPAPLLALRTCKADLICGLQPGQDKQISAKHTNWLIEGNYGVIQYDAPSCKN